MALIMMSVLSPSQTLLNFELITWWAIVSAILLGIFITTSVIMAITSICTCCDFKGRRAKKLREQEELDASTLPPPEPVSMISTVECTLIDEPYILIDESKKTPKDEKRKAKKPTAKEVKKNVVVSKNQMNAYQTMAAVDSPVFRKPNEHVTICRTASPDQYVKIMPSSQKYVSQYELARYRTLAIADSIVFDQKK